MLRLCAFVLAFTIILADHDLSHLKRKAKRILQKKQSDSGFMEGSVRLVDGASDSSGRVEVYHAGRWGTVCDDWWEDSDAAVVCRQLGFTGGIARVSAAFGQGTGDILLDNVECSGSEDGLSICRANPWENHNCGHHEDAGVDCDPVTYTEGDVRLVNGPTYMEGRVEIYHSGEWGTVCDDSWDDTDAQVVCSSLGMSGGTAYEDTEYGEGEGQIWLDEVQCEGHEGELAECSSNPFGVNDCWHFEDAGVMCSG